MSLRGYKPKHKKAIWTQAFPEQVQKPDWQPTVSARQKTYLRPVSARKEKERAAYRKDARQFIKDAIARGETCPVVATIPSLRRGRRYGHPISDKLNEVHHMRGRAGALLRDQRFWLAVSKQGHRWIHSHPKQAREHGWLCAPGLWNQPGEK